MQTHFDDQHSPVRGRFLEELRSRAEQTKEKCRITGGEDGEPVLAEWKHDGMQVVHRPDDPQGIVRISVGGGDRTPVILNYCTIRGRVGDCITLLERAIEALRRCPE